MHSRRYPQAEVGRVAERALAREAHVAASPPDDVDRYAVLDEPAVSGRT